MGINLIACEETACKIIHKIFTDFQTNTSEACKSTKYSRFEYIFKPMKRFIFLYSDSLILNIYYFYIILTKKRFIKVCEECSMLHKCNKGYLKITSNTVNEKLIM